MEDINICVFGDSMAWGSWDPEGGGWVQRWRALVEKTREDVTIYNVSINGDTTRDVLKRFDIEAEARRPNVIIFALGYNDSATDLTTGVNQVSPEDFVKNINALLVKAKKYTDRIYWVGECLVDDTKTQPAPFNLNLSYSQDSVTQYNILAKSAVVEAGSEYIDLSDTLTFEDLDDGLHPNAKGHEKIAGIIEKAVSIR